MKKITFTLPLEALGNATKALLLGDFNDWNLDKAISLEVQKDGTLAATIDLEPGKSYEYRFLLDNGEWINDWSAQEYVHNAVFNVVNSLVVVSEEKVVAKKEAKTKAPAKKAKATKAVTPKVKKEKTAAPAINDDLTKIEGIGPKIAALLNEGGIKTYKDLGKVASKSLKGILDAAGSKFQMHDPTSWPKQAKLAAAGKWDDLKTLQDKLVAGK